jgi:carboxypeptidase C (cathepsin A)
MMITLPRLRFAIRVPLLALTWAIVTAAISFSAAGELIPKHVAASGPSAPVVTTHGGVFNGKQVVYDAIVESIIVKDAAGKPAARLVSTSYIASGTRNTSVRPILFVFNGGPIVPSVALHMGAFGPKRLAIPDDISADASTYKLVDNPYTLLDVADIAFFDPAGTGFSRVLEGVDPKSYFSVTSDGQQCAQFVVEWSRKHGRLSSAKFLFGESYGTLRACATANQLEKLSPPVALCGVILMGQALNIIEFCQRPANIISYVVSLPTLAAIAWSHGKVDLHGRTFEQFLGEARQFARTDYLTALFQGNALDKTRRRAIAERLADLTGISADFYLAHDLRITKDRYRRELFRDQGLILGMLDARYKGPNSNSASGRPPEDPSEVVPKAYDRAFRVYMRDELKVAEAAQYRSQNPTPKLESWGWGATTPFSDWPYANLLANVFASQPKFCVMVANGYQDTETTVGAAQYLVEQAAWPADRVTIRFYQGGHMAYSVEDSLRRMTEDVRKFMSER